MALGTREVGLGTQARDPSFHAFLAVMETNSLSLLLTHLLMGEEDGKP